ncbi:hypothetical protein PYW08_013198 [Mythimna loreyi]|uniref:Uncharacterized protein n=1 Tax=Mythimna loreyi TaxID=667449 RepID=A0ACC2QEW0_9NEOP|nr:hypothetical protein PYW08_013198 [Mythimna loreyi]
MIERVQYKFLRTVHYRCYGYYLSYQNLLTKYKLLTLENRRQYLEAMNLYNIVRNKFDCIDLSNLLCYVVPRTVHKRKARAGKLFTVGPCKSNSGLRSPVRRMVDAYNETFEHIDIFACSPYMFKSLILKELS